MNGHKKQQRNFPIIVKNLLEKFNCFFSPKHKNCFTFASNLNCMKDKATILRIVLLVSIMALFAFLRVYIEIPNFSPIAAIALFGGTFISRKAWAMFVPLAILFVSDAFIGFYSPFLMAFVYASFAIIAGIGFWLRNNMKVQNVIGASLFSSVLIFTITNLGVWAEGLWYPMTLTGLGECFAMAIPFFRYEVAGTMLFTLVFFGIYQLSITKISVFKTA